MDNHPSCRRLHKIPAHTFKDQGKWPQRRSRVLRSFLRSEPPIIAGFSASSTPFFKAVSPEWTLLPMLLRRWARGPDRKSTRLNSSHSQISYAVFCLKKKNRIHSCVHHQTNNR